MFQTTYDDFYLRKISRRYDEIRRYLYSNVTQITDINLRETVGFEKHDEAVKKSGYKKINAGDRWGGDGKSGWFKLNFTLPNSFKGKRAVALLDFGFEACVFLDGVPLQGIDRFHDELLLLPRAKGGEEFSLVAEAMSGAYWQNHKDPAQLRRADVATCNVEVQEFWYSLGVLLDLARGLGKEDIRRAKLIFVMNKAVDAFDYDKTDEKSLKESAVRANKILRPEMEKPASPSANEFTLCGHSHIDVAWLWPYAETIRKCSRTFSTASHLMEQYPNYHFTQSQAQLYEYTKIHYPALYEKIKKWVKTGRWDVNGSMWVEADCNLSSGESLVRQVMFGKSYFMEEFGIETDVLWLPDVFGYSAALPQILKKSGVPYFTTIKISWSQFNKFPYHSFYWYGIDGTPVLAHFPPSGDYNARLLPSRLKASMEAYKERDRAEDAMQQFGHGDGGGGATREHLENAARMKNLEGLPRMRQDTSSAFFKRLEERSVDLPVWRGELYLELHRGTYTTQAANKRNNRKVEFAYRDAEFLGAIDHALGGKYPAKEMHEGWKIVLRNQFHDVIPGSSVRAVYDDSDAQYVEAFSLAAKAEQGNVTSLLKRIDTRGEGQAVVVFNTLSWDRKDTVSVQLPDDTINAAVKDTAGRTVPSQIIENDGRRILSFDASVPSMGYATYRLVEGEAPESTGLKVTAKSLENAVLRVKLDNKGQIASIYDKVTGREVLDGTGNRIEMFEDKPNAWDAWDVDVFHYDKGEVITDVESIEVDETGPVRASIKTMRRFSNSWMEQRIVMYANSRRIDFETVVDWHESYKFLKTSFPVQINAASARYEIQYGNVERPAHSNTSWDMARFEVCAHKWVDLSEGGYGVSLINDCKYGHNIWGNVMRLSLLRSPKEPDPNADMGMHQFTYSLMPHPGSYIDAETVRRAYELNVPMKAFVTGARAGKMPAAESFFSVDAENVVIEAVKKAEEGNAIIIRLYDAHNERTPVILTSSLPIKSAAETDLLEREVGPLTVSDNSVTFDISPFEIKTIKLTVGGGS